MRIELGRHVLGAAAFLWGVVALSWHDFDTWQQLQSLWSSPVGHAIVYIAAFGEIAGGIAIQSRRTARAGALVLVVIYLFFACRHVPRIMAAPLVYDGWGNLFEQLSIVSGAVIVYGTTLPASASASRICQAGRYLFGLCVISFTLEQLFYLRETAGFVPKWIPPGQMFWAITTTVALALGAAAVLSGRMAVLASRLLTAMMLLFGLLLWLPAVLSDPHNHMNWGANAQNLAITAASWIVADLFSRGRPAREHGNRTDPLQPQTT